MKIVISRLLFHDDPEGDDLEYSFNLDNGIGVLEDDILTITPNLNFNGNIELTVSVSDGELSDSETLTINVLPINDASISEISNSELGEDGSFLLALDVLDIDSGYFTVCQ